MSTGTRVKTAGVEARIVVMASRQGGLVTRDQLLASGLTPRQVRYRLTTGRLRSIQRGVYVVGAITAPNARERAAALCCGPTAVVSHRSAATLWGLLPPLGEAAPVDITDPEHNRRIRGIRSHRVVSLSESQVTKVTGIPVTTAARTIIDIAANVRGRMMEQALAQVERHELASAGELLDLIERHPKRHGMRPLRALLEDDASPAMTRSEAEERFLALLRKTGLPDPEVNIAVGRYELDFFWRVERVAVEVDGFAFHSSRRRFEGDRRRDAQLAARGIRMVRVTWRQIQREPEAVLVRLAQILARAELS